ncbi:hypothetical protein [Stutzerimonas stutzeri]
MDQHDQALVAVLHPRVVMLPAEVGQMMKNMLFPSSGSGISQS